MKLLICWYVKKNFLLRSYFAVNCSKVINCLFSIKSPMTYIPLSLKCIRPSFIPGGKSGLLCKGVRSERWASSPAILRSPYFIHIFKNKMIFN